MNAHDLRSVYVVGAGFSAGLGFPTTSDLLNKLLERIDKKSRSNIINIIKFHFHDFEYECLESYPDIEALLSHIESNIRLFDYTRESPGKFKKKNLVDARQELLWQTSQLFHEIYKNIDNKNVTWHKKFYEIVVEDSSTIISFNWDLVLDGLFYNDSKDEMNKIYGFRNGDNCSLLLKPHGSLNWFDGKQAAKIKSKYKECLATERDNSTYVFSKLRSPISKVGRKYLPLIIPPHFMKEFNYAGFRKVWNASVSKISTASEVIFLGYSMPASDFHARLLFRCGFHNQSEGELDTSGNRRQPTGSARVIVVNPDKDSALRIKNATAPHNSFKWEQMTVKQWIEDRLPSLPKK